jgi:glutamyl-tRNA reductase
MNLFSIGISHHTASVDVRERMWLSVDETKEALARLQERYFTECVLVSTCNRTELYGLASTPLMPDGELKRFLIDFKHANGSVQEGHFSASVAGSAVNHLFKVATGIDSMVIGDIQILNQVKEAFALARETGALGPVMNRLMQSTLHVGKRVRSETAICEGAVSVSYAAVELASKIFADLSKKAVLLIGAGETGELTMTHLLAKGVGQVRIANRTREKAEALVARFGGEAVEYSNMIDALRTVDIVITSVNSPSYVVQPDDIHRVMKQRSNNPLFIIDIGVPRNVNPLARKIANVFLYDIDTLDSVVGKNIEKRQAEIPKATRMIREELIEFFHWYNALQVGPTITDLRDSFELIRQQEVGKNINRFKAEDHELVELVTKRIINKILHEPTTVLKQGAGSGGAQKETLLRIQALRELFGIMKGTRSTDDA